MFLVLLFALFMLHKEPRCSMRRVGKRAWQRVAQTLHFFQKGMVLACCDTKSRYHELPAHGGKVLGCPTQAVTVCVVCASRPVWSDTAAHSTRTCIVAALCPGAITRFLGGKSGSAC